MRITQFGRLKPKFHVDLRNGMSMYDTVSRKWKWCIFILPIFNLIKITLEVHFNRIALFMINWESNNLALCAIATTFLHQGRGSHNMIASRQQGLRRKNVVFYRSARNPYAYHLASHKPYRTVAGIPEWEGVQLPYLKISYPEWFQNHRTQIGHHHSGTIRSLTTPCSDHSLRSVASNIRVFLRVSNVAHVAQSLVRSHRSFLSACSSYICHTMVAS